MSHEAPRQTAPILRDRMREPAAGAATTLDCGAYLRAWSAGTRIGSVVSHVEECPYCRAVRDEGVTADRATWERERERAEQQLTSRRKYLKYGVGTSAIVLGAIWFGFGQSGDAKMTQKYKNARPAINLARNQPWFNTKRLVDHGQNQLSTFYRRHGRVGVHRRLTGGTDQEAKDILRWIIDAPRPDLFDLVVDRLTDNRPQVRTHAIRSLRRMPKRNAVDFLPSIRKVINAEPNQRIKRLLTKIEDGIKNG